MMRLFPMQTTFQIEYLTQLARLHAIIPLEVFCWSHSNSTLKVVSSVHKLKSGLEVLSIPHQKIESFQHVLIFIQHFQALLGVSFSYTMQCVSINFSNLDTMSKVDIIISFLQICYMAYEFFHSCYDLLQYFTFYKYQIILLILFFPRILK